MSRPPPARVGQSKRQGDIAPVAEPQDVRPADGLCVHKAQQVGGKLADGEGGRPPGRLPVSPRIQGVHSVFFRKICRLLRKIAPILTVAVEQQQGRPLAAAFLSEEPFKVLF